MRRLSTPDNLLVQRIQEEFRRSRGYSIGADCRTRADSGPTTYQHCYRNGQQLCDLTRLGSAAHNIGAGAAGLITVVPTNTQYFEPVAAFVIGTENANPNTNVRFRLTSVEIAGSPQEAIDDRAPTAATTQYLLSDTYTPTDYGPWPVQWGVFSVAALTKPLVIHVFNQQAVPIDVNVVVFGNPLDHLPPGCKVGEPVKRPLSEAPMPRNGNGRYPSPQ